MNEELKQALDRIALWVGDPSYGLGPMYNRVVRWRYYWDFALASTTTASIAVLSGDVLVVRDLPVGAPLLAGPKIQWYAAAQRVTENDVEHIPQIAAQIVEKLFAKMIEG